MGHPALEVAATSVLTAGDTATIVLLTPWTLNGLAFPPDRRVPARCEITGAMRLVFRSHLAGLGWHDLCGLEQLPDRRPVRRQLGYLSLLVYRQGAEVNVLSDRCSHLGGPLHQGRIVVERGAACVACPWHGSTFAIADGAVVHGPATARQPAFETRVTAAGRVELRPRP